MDIHALREDYKKGELRRKDLYDDPFKQFEKWFQQACNAEFLLMLMVNPLCGQYY
jgi:pyridoxamine 5'-phosphate oxidase